MYLPAICARLPQALVGRLGISVRLPSRIARHWRIQRLAQRRVERRLLRDVRRSGAGALVWLWPDVAIGTVRRLKDLGAVIVREMINTHRGTAKRVLDAEAGRLAVSPPHGISDRSVADERVELAAVDVVVSPSTCVDASLAEWGVPDAKILRTSFGWSPTDRSAAGRRHSRPGTLHVLFAGTLSYRKGVHLALEAWKQAGIDGCLTLIGGLENGMAELLDRYRSCSVRHVPFSTDIASYYAAADVLLFPTLEEGAPLVCYEAAGAGLPIITSPMGQARIVEHERNGLVIDAHDTSTLAAALRRMADDPDWRHRLGENARADAMRYRWQDAADTRRRLILERLDDRWRPEPTEER